MCEISIITNTHSHAHVLSRGSRAYKDRLGTSQNGHCSIQHYQPGREEGPSIGNLASGLAKKNNEQFHNCGEQRRPKIVCLLEV